MYCRLLDYIENGDFMLPKKPNIDPEVFMKFFCCINFKKGLDLAKMANLLSLIPTFQLFWNYEIYIQLVLLGLS